MKRITLVMLTIITAITASGQDITGQWNGALKVQATQLRLVFHITKTETGFSSTMDSPDQGAKGIPVTTTTFVPPVLKLEIPKAGIEYTGELNQNTITGTFKQGGQAFPLNLSRDTIEKQQQLQRPQEPAKPYPYHSEDIFFENKKANITLAGTLTLPAKEGNYPAVVLISGSGPENRDEEIFGHKPFLIISDYLTKNGIAVLRYDDRGVALSKGDFKKATTADFAADVESAVAYLQTRKEIDKTKIGLIGHSEGGMIAPLVASTSGDIRFIVLLAGPGLRGDKLMLLQKEKIERQMGVPETQVSMSQHIFSGAYQLILKSGANDVHLKDSVQTYFVRSTANSLPVEQVTAITNQLVNPWMISFLSYDPLPALEKVTCPVLVMNGDKDLQVPAKENLAAIATALKKGKNKNVTIRELPNLNHLFQECKTGLPAEYATIDQTFSPAALTEISVWIQAQTK